MRNSFFRGLQEVTIAPVIQNPIVNDLDTEDLVEHKSTTPKSNYSKNINNNKNEYNHFQYKQTKILSKDSIDDFDDMLQDFEKKYSQPAPITKAAGQQQQQQVKQNEKLNAPKSGKFQIQTNVPKTNASKRSMIKTPNNNANNNAMRDSIFAQFKDDPIFSELLQTNTMMNSKTNSQPKNQQNNNILNNNTNLQRTKTILDSANSNHRGNNINAESSQQKKKFDDLFNAINNSPENLNSTSNFINSTNNNHNKISNNTKNKNLLDEFLLDDENVKPSVNKNKLNKPVVGVNSTSNMNANNHIINGYDSGNHNVNNNKRKGINQAVKSGRKDILEEIFGDDLFASISNRAHTPAMSKNKPVMSKKAYNNPNSNTSNIAVANNRYEDLFGNNSNQKNSNNQQKDPFDFVLDYDQSFLRDDHNKHTSDNQFNTRRSRFVGKLVLVLVITILEHDLIFVKVFAEW